MTSTAERAKQIRETLKAKHGWTSRQVSVKTHNYSMGSSINVRVNDPDIDLMIVKAIAEGHEHVDRDGYGEILSGGNRFVFVTWGYEAEEEHGRRYFAAVEAALATLEGQPDSRLAPVGDTGLMVGHHRNNGSTITLWSDKGWEADCYGVLGAAQRIGARMVAQS